jgi:Ligated ion channel L-glutamate- and glycine-binding site
VQCYVLIYKSFYLSTASSFVVHFSLFHVVSVGVQQEFCCHGYAMDLLVKLSRSVNFTYSLHLVEDNSYGTFEKVSEYSFSRLTVHFMQL